MDNSLTILVGIPGCGKSTWAATMFPDHIIVSSDAIRAELGDINDQNRNSDVFDIFHQRITDALVAGANVVADSTALDRRARLKLLTIAHWHGHLAHLIIFSNLDQAMARNAARDRVVPADVMIRMIAKYFQFCSDRKIEDYDSTTEISSVA